MTTLNHERLLANMNMIAEDSDWVAREMSCGGRFRQMFYEDRRVKNIILV